MNSADIDKLQAGDELDRLVAEKVMGWTYFRGPITIRGSRSLDSWQDKKEKWAAPATWSPSKDRAAAFEVAVKLRLTILPTSWNTWIVFREEFTGNLTLANGKMRPFQVEAEDLPVAICKSALKHATRGEA